METVKECRLKIPEKDALDFAVHFEGDLSESQIFVDWARRQGGRRKTDSLGHI